MATDAQREYRDEQGGEAFLQKEEKNECWGENEEIYTVMGNLS